MGGGANRRSGADHPPDRSRVCRGQAAGLVPPRGDTPPRRPYPRITAQRLDGVPWKSPLGPLKLGVFQELRDSILTGQPYPARGWFIARQNPVLSLPDGRRTLEALGKLDFIAAAAVLGHD